MKHLITLTLAAVLAAGIAGCNKTEKVSATATCAGQCDDLSNCDPSKCASAQDCPMAAKASAKPAATGAASSCCPAKAKAKVKPAAAQDCDPANCDPAACKGKGKAGCDKAAKAAGCNKAKAAGCPLSGKK